MKSFTILKCNLLQAKIGDPPTKKGSKDGPVLSLATKYWCRAAYHQNVEAVFFSVK